MDTGFSNPRIKMARRDPRVIMRDRGRMRRRDASNASALLSGNKIGPAESLRMFGWIGPALATMGSTSRWAYSLNPDNDVIAAPGMPLEGLFTSPASLLNSCELAVAGQSGKTSGAVAWPAVAAAQTITLTANTAIAFGALVRISNAATAFKYGTYEIQFCTGATVLSYVYVQVASLPCEVVILSINNNAGKAAVVGNSAPAVIFPYSAVSGAIGNLNAGSMATGDVLQVETLNLRDIGNVVDAVSQGAILI